MEITLAKAIEILDFNIKEADPKMPPDVEAAVKMGTTAQKAILQFRKDGDYDALLHLDGEAIIQ